MEKSSTLILSFSASCICRHADGSVKFWDASASEFPQKKCFVNNFKKQEMYFNMKNLYKYITSYKINIVYM